MSKKIKMSVPMFTFEECFERFLLNRRAKGLSDKSLSTYAGHFKAICKYYLPADTEIDLLKNSDLDEMVSKMRNSGRLSTNSINSYTRTLKTFFTWCNEENITNVNIKIYKTEETVKDTYTDAELRRLLKKPDMRKCSFAEYRTWVMINLLLNSGMRAATLRNILIKDLLLDRRIIVYRHNKNKTIQTCPLCSEMIVILKEYLKVRGGNENDYLFPCEGDTGFTENGLRLAIVRYNKRRGVQKTSIHLFRHTFAERFLKNGGSPFELQKILGHSTLEMTKHYCRIYDFDLVKNFDNVSPLANLSKK